MTLFGIILLFGLKNHKTKMFLNKIAVCNQISCTLSFFMNCVCDGELVVTGLQAIDMKGIENVFHITFIVEVCI